MSIPILWFALGFIAGALYTFGWVAFWDRRAKRKPKVPRKLARDCGTCRHVIYAEYCDCPQGTMHYHSIGMGVVAPCTDTRCPEGRTS